MTAVTLYRIDPARDMCWFYALDVLPDLFGSFHGRKGMGLHRPSRPVDRRAPLQDTM
jgi:hypothetical protein